MEGFREAVYDCSFLDLGFIRLPYTWDNRQQGTDNVKVRLDRGLATSAFLSMFRDVKVWHVQTIESNHCSLVLECSNRQPRRRWGRRSFRYENMWCRDPSYLRWNQLGGTRRVRAPEGEGALEHLA
jgi:hypothetical protein